MAIVQYIGVTPLVVDNTSLIVPTGFKSCSFINTGAGDAVLTQNGKSWTLPAGGVFNLDNTRDNNAWLAVTINAAGTVVEAVYY